MSLQLSQGGESNLSGQFLEEAVIREFKTRGVPVFEGDLDKHHNSDWVSEIAPVQTHRHLLAACCC